MRGRRNPLLVAIVAFVAGVLAAAVFVPDHTSPADDPAVAAGAARRAPGAFGPTGATGAVAEETGAAPGAQAATGGPAGGGTAEAGASAGPAAAGAVAADPSGSAAQVQGVTDTTITIGFGAAETGAIAAIDPVYDYGDMREYAESVLAGWNRTGVLPVHGRTIELAHRAYSILSTEEQRAACVGWANDDRVFAVVGVRRLFSGAQCLTQEFGIPVVNVDAATDEDLAAGPLFALQQPIVRTLRNWPHWAHERGFLKGKTIGLYYPTEAEPAVEEDLKPNLEALGYELAVEVSTDSPVLGGPQDQVAVQQFRANGVDLALLFTAVPVQVNFMRYAENQGYRPTYLNSDALGATDAAASTLPPEQADGHWAMTSFRPYDFSDPANPKAPTPEGQRCMDGFAAHAGAPMSGDDLNSLKQTTLRMTCDAMAVLLEALEGAGRNLDHAGFIRALEGIRNLPMAYHSFVTFGPTKHFGADENQSSRWWGRCRCWLAEPGGFRPMWVD